LLREENRADGFTAFVASSERGIRLALSAAFGSERGREAAAEALAYGWEHWDRIAVMGNPAGYLYRVGRDRARRMSQSRNLALAPVRAAGGDVWVEPGLPAALAGLPERQRVAVALVHGHGWSMSQVAELLGVSKGTVQSYVERGLKRLRRDLGVEL